MALANETDLTALFTGSANPATTVKETSGPTDLAVSTITDGEYLKRSGSTIISAAIAGGGDMLKSENLSGLANYATAWTNMGISSAATLVSSYWSISSHVHSASHITSSTLAVARIAAGTANISTFADGTGNWSVPVYGNISSLPTLGTAASTAAADYASSTHNISSATHTFPGGTTNFLRADGTFAAPPAGSSNISTIRTTSLVFSTTTSSLPLTGFGFTVSNTVNYSFEFGLIYASAISSTGLRVGLQFPATSTFAANVEIPNIVATGTDSRTQGYIIASGSSVVAPATPLASTQYIATVWGQILPSANGTLQFCYAPEVAGVAISTFAGSYGILTQY